MGDLHRIQERQVPEPKSLRGGRKGTRSIFFELIRQKERRI
jgi:hypothetical protein